LKLVQRLDEESPGTNKYVAALARWKAQLGAALQQLRRPEEAESAYRQSIAHDEWLAKHVPDPAGVRWVVANHQGALAQVLLQLGRRDEARALLDRSSEELEALADEGPRFPGAGRHFAECITRMMGTYEQLGETDRAAELNERAAELRHRRE